MRIGWIFLGSTLAACAGGTSQIDIASPPPPRTSGVFAGPLCTGDSCTCATTPAEAGIPEGEGYKRFEVRLKSSQQLWLKVRDTVMYKNPERVEACFYLDLPSGDSPIEMRASDPNGVSAEWQIREIGAKTASFYETFTFNCGNPGVCSFDELRDKKTELQDPKHDRCGSVKVKQAHWDTGRAPDQLHPSDLLVRATLDVYKFVPDRPHGEDCSKKQAAEHTEDNPKY